MRLANLQLTNFTFKGKVEMKKTNEQRTGLKTQSNQPVC